MAATLVVWASVVVGFASASHAAAPPIGCITDRFNVEGSVQPPLLGQDHYETGIYSQMYFA